MTNCAKCGAILETDSVFCSSCGTQVTPSTQSFSTAPTPIQRGSRPGGITLLTILEGIVSCLMLLGGVALIGISAFLASGGWDLIPEIPAEVLQQVPWASTFTGISIIALTTSILMGLGVVLLILAVVGFIMTWGLWSGKSWARTITMIHAVISIVAGIFSLPGSLIGILINIGMLYYLTRPHIQAYYQ